MNQTLLSRQQFIGFFISQAEMIFGKGAVTQTKDDFSYSIKLGKDSSEGAIYLGNVWNNYQRSGDIGCIVTFLTAQKQMLEMINNPEIDMSKLLPVLRAKGQTQRSMAPAATEKGITATLMNDSFSTALDILYVEDNESFVSFVMENRLPEGVTSDEASVVAFENLKKKGWVGASEVEQVSAGAKVHIFQHSNESYHAQFMVKEMYEAHLGEYFLVSFPTRDIAFALSFDGSPMANLQENAANAAAFKQMTVDAYRNYPSPLSHVIHAVGNGTIKALG